MSIFPSDGSETLALLNQSVKLPAPGSARYVALNFGDAPVHAAYQGLSGAGSFTDWFSKGAVALPANGTIDIPAHGYRVLVR